MAGKTENEKLRDRPKKDLKQQKTGSGRILKIIYYVLLGVLGPASIYIPFLMREARNDPALAHLYQTQNRSGAPDQIKSPYEIWFQEKIEGKHPEAKKRSDINYKNLGSLFGGTWVVDSPFGGFLDLVVSELTLDQLARMSQWKAARHFQKDQTDIAELLHPFKSGLNRGDYLDSQVRETPILSVEALRELWQVFMGEPYDLYRVIEQAAMDEWPYAVGHPEKTQIPEDYISGLFYNVATADVPFETKRTYLKMLRKRSFVEQKDLPRWAMKTHDMKKLHEVMTAMNAYQWAEADEDRLLEATYFLTEMIGTDWDYNSMTADRFKKALDDHGGLAGIAEKLKDNPSLGLRFIQLRKRYDDMIPMYTVRAYYDEIANWTLEEHEYFINGSFAFSESIKMSPYTVGYFMSKAFEDGGFVVTPSFFYDLMDREKFEGILRGWLSKSFEAKDGGYAVKTIDDFKLLMKYWDELSRINQGELLLGLADFSLLPAVIDYESAANLVFKTMNSNADVITAVTLAYVPSAYSPIDPELSSIDSPEDFKKRLWELRLLKLFQSSAKGLDKFKTYAASLITASQRRLPEYVNALTEDEFASFIVLIDHLAEGGSQMVELSEQLSRQYFLKQGWTSIPRFKDLSYVESIRTRLNEGSFVSGDKFIFHLGMAFLDENPVSADNIDDYFEIITGWMEAKDIHHDIQHLYQQIASFAANEIVTFLEANPSARKHEQYRQQLLKLGFAMDGSEASIILSGHEEMKKLMAYLSTGNYQRIGQKINSLTNFNTITIQDVETRDSARGDVEEGFELLDVLVGGKEGANVGYLVKGKTGIAKVMTAYDIGFKGGGIGREDFSSYRKGPLVADFVGAFTTAKKPTDFAMENGLVKNWIMSPSRQTAMTIVYPNGRMHIADKHDMKLSELYTDPSDLAANEDRPLDMRNRRDVMRLIRVGQQQKLSINTNLLLLREDQIAKINDGNDSRRLLLEFPPDQESPKGYFGLLALTREMSTRQAAEIAYKLGASRAMYTDTGYHDYATITVKKTVDGKQVIEIMVVGHADAVKSINRFFFYVDPKDAETPKPVEINHDKSKKPSGARMAIDETSDRPADGRDDIADDRIYRQIGTAISETRVKWAALADGPAFKFGDRMSWRYAVSNGHEYIDADGVSSSYDGIPADIEGDPATRGAFLVALDSVAENNLQHVFLPDYGNHAAIGQGSWLFGEQYIQMFTAIDNGRGFDADDDSVTIFDALKRGVGAGRWHHAGEAFTDMVQALTLTLIASNGKAALVVPAAFAQNNPLLSTTQLRILPEFPGHYVVDLDAEALPKGALVAGFKYSTDIPAADELTQMIIASLLKGLKGGQVPGAADASNAANLQNGIKIDPQPGVEGARLSSAEILAPLGLRISAMPGDEAFDVLATTFWQADGRSGLGRRVAGQMSPVAAERSQDRQIRFNEEQIVALIKCMVVDINPDTAKVPALPAWMVNQLLSTNILAGDLLMLFKTLEAVFGGLVIVDPTGELKKILPEGSKVRFVSTYADLAKNTMLLESAEVIKRLKDEGVLKGGYHVAARAHGIEVGGEGQLIAQIFLLALHAVSDQMPTGLARKQGLLETYGDYWKGSFVGEIGEGDQYLVAGEVLAIKLLRAISAAMTGAALTHSMTRSSA